MSIRPNFQHHNHQHHGKVIDENNKKELKQETADIGGFTLMFDDADMETKWNVSHLDRQRAITARYLLCASIFQGLFFWSDVIEHQSTMTHNPDYSSSLKQMAIIRFILGGFPLLACFLVATGLLIPSQMNVFWMNICYGIPSLAIKYLMSPLPSHWDSLFLVYGLCFFVLPKISPLNFIFGFSGAVIFSILFLYLSSFRLSFQEWLLSNILLLFVVVLFCYISYSSERVGRERWLLRQRLQREKIDLRIVASSIRDDIVRVSNDERPFPLDAMHYQSNIVFSSRDRAMRFLSSIRGRVRPLPVIHIDDHDDHDDDDNKNQVSASSSPSSSRHASINKNDRMVLFFKGIAAWALCYGMGYAFDRASSISSSSSHSEINTSAAFALLMHTMGFSVFLLYVTGQLRWIALNGVVSLVMLRIFNRTIDSKWVVFSTHTVGYIILVICIIIMFLVFGGVVLVWTQLINFLQQILIKYPHVKEEILENRVLEQVLIDYIADMPSNKHILHDKHANVSKVLHVVDRLDDDHDDKVHAQDDVEVGYDMIHAVDIIQQDHHKTIISGRRPNTCYFCLKPDPSHLIPTCSAWMRHTPTSSSPSSSSSSIPMCTPYTNLALERDDAMSQVDHLRTSLNLLEEKHHISLEQHHHLHQRLQDSDHMIQTLNMKLVDIINAEKKKHEAYIQDMLSYHNAQLTGMKKMNKALHLKLLKVVKDYQHLELTSSTADVSESVIPASTSSSFQHGSDAIQSNSKKEKPSSSSSSSSSKAKSGNKPKANMKDVSKQTPKAEHISPSSSHHDIATADSHEARQTSSATDIDWDVDDLKYLDLNDFDEIEKLLSYELSLFSDSVS